MAKKRRIVIALGGNALGNTLPEQMAAVKITAKAIVDLIEEGCEVVVAHGNGPQVGMVNNAMIALTHEDAQQPNTPLSVCVAMSQAYIGYDLQNALREELLNRGITDMPVATMITQVRVDENDPAFQSPSKPIGKFVSAEQAKMMEENFQYIIGQGVPARGRFPEAGRDYRNRHHPHDGRIRRPGNCLRRRRHSGYPPGQPFKRCQRCDRQGFRKLPACERARSR